MKNPPLLQLSDIALTYGGSPVFDGLDLVVQPGDRLALVGRNGSGKSTLMKIMTGAVEPDSGAVVPGPGVHLGYMEQDPDMSGFATLGDFALNGLEPGEGYKIEIIAEGLKFDPARAVSVASGGERRRAALARLMAEEPELMLLDEPTNHLDIEAIAWLEDALKSTRSGFVLISHDRAFLSTLTRGLLWLDRGRMRRADIPFDAFEAWRDKLWAEEDLQRHKLNRKIKAEARWAVEGISARRKRNMGRVRALKDLRATRAAGIKRQGAAALAFEAGQASGRKVIETHKLAKSFGDRTLVSGFSLTVQRGDCVAFVGPNGVGKTTLIKMLLGEVEPDAGTVKHGTNLEIAVFDQARAQLDPEATLWESLTSDPALSVGGQADQVMVRGTARHVIGYLKDFLFDESRARAPVRSLSGGEKARLLLARIMARPSNLLVLDEPTNDLDIETLDLLQEILDDYDGTVLLVSHDRAFLDRVATITIAMEGDGKATAFAGGWSDYQSQRGPQVAPALVSSSKPAKSVSQHEKTARAEKRKGLSFTETHRFEELPAEIERLEAEIAKLETLLSDPLLFSEQPVKFRKATEALKTRQDALMYAEEEWLLLAEKAEI